MERCYGGGEKNRKNTATLTHGKGAKAGMIKRKEVSSSNVLEVGSKTGRRHRHFNKLKALRQE